MPVEACRRGCPGRRRRPNRPAPSSCRTTRPSLLVRAPEDRLAALVLDRLAGGELALALAAEEVQLAGIVGAGDQVEDAVAVEVHELRTGADASVDGDFGVHAAGLEVDRLGVARLLVRALVAVEAEQAAEVADDQVPDAVAIDVLDPRAGMAPGGPAVDDAVGSREAGRGVEAILLDTPGLVVRRPRLAPIPGPAQAPDPLAIPLDGMPSS